MLFGLMLSADARLIVRLLDHKENPIRQARIQIIPGEIHPDKDTPVIMPSQPRTDGLAGFVTKNKFNRSFEVTIFYRRNYSF